jgi:hypothetical protein
MVEITPSEYAVFPVEVQIHFLLLFIREHLRM